MNGIKITYPLISSVNTRKLFEFPGNRISVWKLKCNVVNQTDLSYGDIFLHSNFTIKVIFCTLLVITLTHIFFILTFDIYIYIIPSAGIFRSVHLRNKLWYPIKARDKCALTFHNCGIWIRNIIYNNENKTTKYLLQSKQHFVSCVCVSSNLISLWFIWLWIMINWQYNWPYQL